MSALKLNGLFGEPGSLRPRRARPFYRLWLNVVDCLLPRFAALCGSIQSSGLRAIRVINRRVRRLSLGAAEVCVA